MYFIEGVHIKKGVAASIKLNVITQICSTSMLQLFIYFEHDQQNKKT